MEYLYVFLNESLIGVSIYDFLLLLCKETAEVNMVRVMSVKHKSQLLLYVYKYCFLIKLDCCF